jgi:hypothetical protein
MTQNGGLGIYTTQTSICISVGGFNVVNLHYLNSLGLERAYLSLGLDSQHCVEIFRALFIR